MKKLSVILVLSVIFVLNTTAVADWAPGDGHKMHYPQMPDLDHGWDVDATYPMVLADDWMCSQTGCVMDIHFWGSWMGDSVGVIDSFALSIHANDPGPPSKPAATLWEAMITDFIVGNSIFPYEQGWYDPSTGFWQPGDHYTCIQYNIFLPESLWFYQVEDSIYWLNISAFVADTLTTHWGWKSGLRLEHFMDDAVWGLWGELNWIEIFNPPDFITSLDLAFVITGGLKKPDAIPTFSEWGLIILALLIVASAVFMLRKRRKVVRA